MLYLDIEVQYSKITNNFIILTNIDNIVGGRRQWQHKTPTTAYIKH
jgi:hypothetical protein